MPASGSPATIEPPSDNRSARTAAFTTGTRSRRRPLPLPKPEPSPSIARTVAKRSMRRLLANRRRLAPHHLAQIPRAVFIRFAGHHRVRNVDQAGAIRTEQSRLARRPWRTVRRARTHELEHVLPLFPRTTTVRRTRRRSPESSLTAHRCSLGAHRARTRHPHPVPTAFPPMTVGVGRATGSCAQHTSPAAQSVVSSHVASRLSA